jgi:hypothetical protein
LSYETFERRVVRTEDPALSILADGRIALNAAATRLFQGAGAMAAKILWDKGKCGIALQAAEKGDKNSYSIYFSRGRSAFISAKTFLPYIGWSSDHTQTVPAKWDAQLKMLEAELPPRFVKMSGGGKLVKSDPTSSDADPFGGNDNNRRVADRIAKERSIAIKKSSLKPSGSADR